MRTLTDARRWMAEGTTLLLEAGTGLGEGSLDGPSMLPGWTRRHVLSHVAANAEALGNLVQWARTGVETPMYGSPEARAAGIARGVALPSAALESWLRRSAENLVTAMDALTAEQWAHQVRTAQGRTVAAGETPWMRAREVMIHAVDLATGLTFADLPSDFTGALAEDIRAARGLGELPRVVAAASLGDITAWLAGRPHLIADAPELGPWL